MFLLQLGAEMDSLLISLDGKTVQNNSLGPKDRPVSIAIITTLEIVLRYKEARYLLVNQFRYADGIEHGEALREAPWAPPAHTKQLTLPDAYDGSIETTQQIVKLFHEIKPSDYDWEAEASRLQSMLGVRGGKLENVGEFIEIKPTFQDPSIKRAYKIVRVRWSNQNGEAEAIRNLTDPLCLRGFAFLPISRKTLSSYNLTRDITITSPLYILGKPLVSNLKHVLCNNSYRGSLREPCVDVRDEHLVLREEGFLVQADMAGFGEACNFIGKRDTPVRLGVDQAEEYRRVLVESFSDILAKAGINQARLTGDGFLCGVPKREDNRGKIPTIIRRFLEAYSDHLEKIEEMNQKLSPRDRHRYAVGSRVALHYGRYDYGRVAGLMPLVADFDGPEIVTVSRSESALKAIGDRIEKKRKKRKKPTGKRHEAIVTPQLTKLLGGRRQLTKLMAANGFRYETYDTTKVKEAKIAGHVFRWSGSPSLPTKKK